MQPLKSTETPQQREAAEAGSFVQRLLNWSVGVGHQKPSNADRFDDQPMDLDQRVRQSGEW